MEKKREAGKQEKVCMWWCYLR